MEAPIDSYPTAAEVDVSCEAILRRAGDADLRGELLDDMTYTFRLGVMAIQPCRACAQRLRGGTAGNGRARMRAAADSQAKIARRK